MSGVLGHCIGDAVHERVEVRYSSSCGSSSCQSSSGKTVAVLSSIPGVRGNPNDTYNAILEIESGTVSTVVHEYSH